jgi:hypothetical protein
MLIVDTPKPAARWAADRALRSALLGRIHATRDI